MPRLVTILVLLPAVLGVAAAHCEETGEIVLGPVDQFATEAQAGLRCAPDGVVWADPETGVYYPRFQEQYGKTPTGFFTCYKQAKRADYWGFGAIDTMGLKGKSFPLERCTTCS